MYPVVVIVIAGLFVLWIGRRISVRALLEASRRSLLRAGLLASAISMIPALGSSVPQPMFTILAVVGFIALAASVVAR